MSITELGSLGEFIGSIAVLATLIYLAYQTRQNGHMLAQSKEAQTASMVQANVAGWDGFFRPILEKPEVARLYRRIKAGEHVSEQDGRTIWGRSETNPSVRRRVRSGSHSRRSELVVRRLPTFARGSRRWTPEAA